MNFFKNFKKSDLTYHEKSSFEEINIDDINQGISQNEHYLFYHFGHGTGLSS